MYVALGNRYRSMSCLGLYCKRTRIRCTKIG
jgi:hypothetical protein